MENQYIELRDYLQSLAENYKPIGHTAQKKRFFENTVDEIKDPAPGAIMYLSPPDFALVEQDGSNRVRVDARISILRNFHRADYPGMHTAIHAAYADCKEILAQMKADRNNPNHPDRCLLSAMDLDDVGIVVDNVFKDGWIGCTIRLDLRIDESFEITPAKWQ